jgi:DNA-binding winged helix-turn-helix (wHTH) protein/TolB-like protein/Flp pilus assembly protein TadD
MPSREELQGGFFVGDYEVLPAKRVIRLGDEELSPEPKVFEVLMSLAMRDGDVVSRDELIDEVWGGRATADGPINRAATQLRGHLNDRQTPYRYIAARHKVGYYLKQPVRLKVEPAVVETAAADAGSAKHRLGILAAAVVVAVIIGAVIGRMTPPFSAEDVDAIGVQPFVVLSDAPGDEYIANGLKAELVTALVQLTDLTIKNGSIDYPGTPVTTIANRLDVGIVLTGTLVRSGEDLQVVWRAENGNDGSVVSSDSVKGESGEIHELQQRLIASVRKALLPGAGQKLITGQQATGAGTDSYYLGLYAMERRGEPGNLQNAIEHFQTAIRLDPNFGPAYLSLAAAYALLPDHAGGPIEESNRLAIEVIEKGIDVDDSIEDAAGAIYGFVYHKEKRWQESEASYLRAINATVVDSNAFNWYSRMLASVGRLDDALEVALKAQRIDPDSPVINSRLAIAYTWLEDSANAAEFFDRTAELQSRGSTHLLANALFMFREGSIDEARELTRESVRQGGGTGGWIEPVFEALTDPAAVADGLEAIATASAEEQISPQVEVIARTLLHDVDGTMRLAWRLEEPGELFEMDLLFIPEMRPLRTHKEFPDLMDALGISEYWAKNGCVFEDHEVDCDAS